MEITAKIEGGVTTISVAGSLDVTTAPQLTESFNHQLQDGHAKLVADFSQLTHVSSVGLRVLLAAVKEARRLGGDVRLAAIQSDEVNKVLRMSGFSNIFKVYPDTPTAVASFGA